MYSIQVYLYTTNNNNNNNNNIIAIILLPFPEQFPILPDLDEHVIEVGTVLAN